MGDSDGLVALDQGTEAIGIGDLSAEVQLDRQLQTNGPNKK